MERTISYALGGCFIGTAASLFLNSWRPNPFLLFLLPMWGMVLSVAVARVINLHNEPEEAQQQKV